MSWPLAAFAASVVWSAAWVLVVIIRNADRFTKD